MKEEVADNRIWFGADGTGVPRIKRFLGDAKQGLTPSTMWSAKDVGANEHAKKQLSQLFDGDVVFDSNGTARVGGGHRGVTEIVRSLESPKPVRLVDHMLSICTDNDHVDVVLDFFAGSGTTAHAVVARNAADGGNRRFVLVQLPESLDPEAKEQKTAADYCDKLNKSRTIAELTKERLRRAAKKVCEDNPLFAGDLGFRVFKLDSSNIQTWDPDRADLAASLEAHAKNLKEDRTEQDILFELLLKLGLDLCVPIVQRTIAGKAIHSIGGGVLLVCLADSIMQAETEPLALGVVAWHKEQAPVGESIVVFRDSAFTDDVAKTNLAAIIQQHGLETVRSL